MAITDINDDVTACIKNIKPSMMLAITNTYDSSIWIRIDNMILRSIDLVCAPMKDGTRNEINMKRLNLTEITR